MHLFALLVYLMVLATFPLLSLANPLQVSNGNFRTTRDVPPAGYTFGKLIYNTTINGKSVQFEGGHRMDIYSQVKAQYPEFQLPTANLTKAKELEEMAALERQPASGIEGRTNDFSGDGWHGSCIPVGGQPWHLANEMNLRFPLYYWQGVTTSYFTVRGRTCVLWECNLGAGWTICNDGTSDQTISEDSITYFPFILLDHCSTFFNDFRSANGGQIWWMATQLNFIGCSNWNSCYGDPEA